MPVYNSLSADAPEGVVVYSMDHADPALLIFTWQWDAEDIYGESGEWVLNECLLIESDVLTAYVSACDLNAAYDEIKNRRARKLIEEQEARKVLSGLLDTYGMEWVERMARSL